MLFLMMWITVVRALDLASVKSKLFTCTEFEILNRDRVDVILQNVHSCIRDTHLFRVTSDFVDESLRDPVHEYKTALDAYQVIQHDAATREAEAKRKIKNIQRNVVATRMNLKYLLAESELPPITHLSDETNLRNVQEYLQQNAQYLEYVKAIPLRSYIVQLQNITSDTDAVEAALAEKELKHNQMRGAVELFRNHIISHYLSYIMQ